MLTRASVRRALTWSGALVGAAACLAYIFCFFGTLTLRVGERMLALGQGSLVYRWKIVAMPTSPSGSTPTPDKKGLFLRGPGTDEWSWLPRWSEPHWGQATVPFPGSTVIPLWMPVLLGLCCAYKLLPVGHRRGHCAKCDYDLRGVPSAADGSRTCPECGTPA
jgi:hypothetical protein